LTRLVTRPNRRRQARLGGALAFAVAVHMAMLNLMLFRSGELILPQPVSTARTVTLTLVRPQRTLAPPSIRKAAAAAAPRAAASSAPTTPSPATVAAAPAPAASSGPAAPAGPSAGLAAGLRGSLLGCANAGALALTEKERQGCELRFAAGGREAAYLSPIPSVKLAYFDAVAKADEDWTSGRDPGHLPFIVCRLGGRGTLAHALKLGPCYLEPPKGSLDKTVDVPEPERDTSTMRHMGE
jgi:hypothetical protein